MIQLVNGLEMNKLHPTTFEIPTEKEKKQVKIGDYVKVCFLEDDKPGERMWVEVKEIKGNTIKGLLSNEPVIVKSLKFKDSVELKFENILNIMSE